MILTIEADFFEIFSKTYDNETNASIYSADVTTKLSFNAKGLD